jgi:uncharacterized protein
MAKFSSKVRECLGYYVYLYIDPRDGKPFYIGKGKGGRVFGHLKTAATKSKKSRFLRDLEALGLQPQIEILKYGLTEDEALLVEATAIDLLDIKKLTNIARGHGSRHGARGSVEEIAAILDAREARISEPSMLININKAFRYGMTTHELYDATRSAWKLGPRRVNAKYAMCVYRGIVRQVYLIAAWVPGGSTMRATDTDGRHQDESPRWEFVGKVADEAICKKYVGKSVARYFKPGAQNPVLYVNCIR